MAFSNLDDVKWAPTTNSSGKPTFVERFVYWRGCCLWLCCMVGIIYIILSLKKIAEDFLNVQQKMHEFPEFVRRYIGMFLWADFGTECLQEVIIFIGVFMLISVYCDRANFKSSSLSLRKTWLVLTGGPFLVYLCIPLVFSFRSDILRRDLCTVTTGVFVRDHLTGSVFSQAASLAGEVKLASAASSGASVFFGKPGYESAPLTQWCLSHSMDWADRLFSKPWVRSAVGDLSDGLTIKAPEFSSYPGVIPKAFELVVTSMGIPNADDYTFCTDKKYALSGSDIAGMKIGSLLQQEELHDAEPLDYSAIIAEIFGLHGMFGPLAPEKASQAGQGLLEAERGDRFASFLPRDLHTTQQDPSQSIVVEAQGDVDPTPRSLMRHEKHGLSPHARAWHSIIPESDLSSNAMLESDEDAWKSWKHSHHAHARAQHAFTPESDLSSNGMPDSEGNAWKSWKQRHHAHARVQQAIAPEGDLSSNDMLEGEENAWKSWKQSHHAGQIGFDGALPEQTHPRLRALDLERLAVRHDLSKYPAYAAPDALSQETKEDSQGHVSQDPAAGLAAKIGLNSICAAKQLAMAYAKVAAFADMSSKLMLGMYCAVAKSLPMLSAVIGVIDGVGAGTANVKKVLKKSSLPGYLMMLTTIVTLPAFMFIMSFLSQLGGHPFFSAAIFFLTAERFMDLHLALAQIREKSAKKLKKVEDSVSFYKKAFKILAVLSLVAFGLWKAYMTKMSVGLDASAISEQILSTLRNVGAMGLMFTKFVFTRVSTKLITTNYVLECIFDSADDSLTSKGEDGDEVAKAFMKLMGNKKSKKKSDDEEEQQGQEQQGENAAGPSEPGAEPASEPAEEPISDESAKKDKKHADDDSDGDEDKDKKKKKKKKDKKSKS